MIELSREQNDVIDGIVEWYRSPGGKKFTVVSGYAGTGKTQTISRLHAVLDSMFRGIRIAYATLTAKAALVLREKGILEAQTMHSLMYDAVVSKDKKGHVHIVFHRKSSLPCGLVVIDEASMVSEDLFNDLLDFGKPVIFVGDSFQLPPVSGSFNIMDDSNVDFRLTHIFRQDGCSEIIDMSERIRNGEPVPFKKTGEVTKTTVKDLAPGEMMSYNQILTGKNSTRVKFNEIYRTEAGFSSVLPQRGERIVFLRNHRQSGVFNGQQAAITDMPVVVGRDLLEVRYMPIFNDVFDMLDARERRATVSSLCFNNQKAADVMLGKSVGKSGDAGVEFADFAYVVSVHKFQGSQAENILILDDCFGVWDKELRQRWLYTAVTRAEKTVRIAMV